MKMAVAHKANIDLSEEGHVSDEALLVLFGNGDRHASKQLMDRLTPRLFNYCARLLNDPAEAEDVTQEAMLRLWKIAPKWRSGEAKITTWLFHVATNLCTDRLRKKSGSGLDEIEEPVDDAPSREAVLIGQQRVDAFNRALNTLPERQKQAVVLRHIEGLSNPEIAQILELSIEAVESLTSRGKRSLKSALANQKKELGFTND